MTPSTARTEETRSRPQNGTPARSAGAPQGNASPGRAQVQSKLRALPGFAEQEAALSPDGKGAKETEPRAPGERTTPVQKIEGEGTVRPGPGPIALRSSQLATKRRELEAAMRQVLRDQNASRYDEAAYRRAYFNEIEAPVFAWIGQQRTRLTDSQQTDIGFPELVQPIETLNSTNSSTFGDQVFQLESSFGGGQADRWNQTIYPLYLRLDRDEEALLSGRAAAEFRAQADLQLAAGRTELQNYNATTRALMDTYRNQLPPREAAVEQRITAYLATHRTP